MQFLFQFDPVADSPRIPWQHSKHLPNFALLAVIPPRSRITDFLIALISIHLKIKYPNLRMIYFTFVIEYSYDKASFITCNFNF
jgi:hypothetical protein